MNQKLIAFLFVALTAAFVASSGNRRLQPAVNEKLTLALVQPAMSNTGSNEISPLMFNTGETSPDQNSAEFAEDAQSAVATRDADNVENTDDNSDEPGLENELARVIVSEKIDNMIETEVPADHQKEAGMVSFASESAPVEFTIKLSATTTPEPPAPPSPEKLYPYVPRNAFEFNEVRDTSFLPGQATLSDMKATLRLAKAIEAIEELDWQKVEQKLDLSREKINPEKLELELKKALLEIDWKSLDKDLANSLKASNADIEKYKTQLATRYRQFIVAKQQRAAAARAAEAAIVEERLKAGAVKPAQKVVKVKKIVSI